MTLRNRSGIAPESFVPDLIRTEGKRLEGIRSDSPVENSEQDQDLRTARLRFGIAP